MEWLHLSVQKQPHRFCFFINSAMWNHAIKVATVVVPCKDERTERLAAWQPPRKYNNLPQHRYSNIQDISQHVYTRLTLFAYESNMTIFRDTSSNFDMSTKGHYRHRQCFMIASMSIFQRSRDSDCWFCDVAVMQKLPSHTMPIRRIPIPCSTIQIKVLRHDLLHWVLRKSLL